MVFPFRPAAAPGMQIKSSKHCANRLCMLCLAKTLSVAENQQFCKISSIPRFAMTMVHVQLRPAEFGTGDPLLSFASQTTSGESGLRQQRAVLKLRGSPDQNSALLTSSSRCRSAGFGTTGEGFSWWSLPKRCFAGIVPDFDCTGARRPENRLVGRNCRWKCES